MKIQHFIILMAGLFVSLLLLGKLKLGLDPNDRFAWLQSWGWVMGVVGGGIAAISVLVLLQRAIAGAALPQMLPPVIPLLGGLLVYQTHWALAVALAAVVVGWTVVEALRPKQGS
jgi:hypothetical protein